MKWHTPSVLTDGGRVRRLLRAGWGNAAAGPQRLTPGRGDGCPAGLVGGPRGPLRDLSAQLRDLEHAIADPRLQVGQPHAVVAGAVSLLTVGLVGTGAPASWLDAALWGGAIAGAFAWWALLQRISERQARRWHATLAAREQLLADARREVLVAARGDRCIVELAGRPWPAAGEPVASGVALAAHSLRIICAVVMGVGIIAAGVGVPDAIATVGGVHPVAYAAALSFGTVPASGLDLGWRWLGWRAEVRGIAQARRLLGSGPPR